jgi:hypothetical protein
MYQLNDTLRISVKGTDYKMQRKLGPTRWLTISHHANLSSAILSAYERLVAEEMSEYSLQLPCHHCAGLGMLESLAKKIDEIGVALRTAVAGLKGKATC